MKGKTLIAGIPIGHGKMNVKMLEETLKEKNIELKMNLNELQRLFNRAQHQLTQLANVFINNRIKKLAYFCDILETRGN